MALERILRLLNGIRTHKKKVIFFSSAAGGAIYYARDQYRLHEEMRRLCTAANGRGQQLVKHVHPGAGRVIYQSMLTDTSANPTEPEEVFILLQPNARSGKGRDHFNKYGAPLLHLAGMKVTYITARDVDEARLYCETLDTCKYLIVAGDDAVILHALSGYLQRFWDNERAIPKQMPQTTIGIVPLQKRSIYSTIFDKKQENKNQTWSDAEYFTRLWKSKKRKVKPINIAAGVQRLLDGRSKRLNMMHVKILNSAIADEDEDVHDKHATELDLFSFVSLQAGPVAEAVQLADKYWYFGILRDKFAALRTSLSLKTIGSPLSVAGEAMLKYERRADVSPAEKAAQLVVQNQIQKRKDEQQTNSRRSWLSQLLPQRTVSKEAVAAIPTNAVADYFRVPARDDDIEWESFQQNSSWLLVQPDASRQHTSNNSAATLSAFFLPALSWWDFIKLKWFHQYQLNPSDGSPRLPAEQPSAGTFKFSLPRISASRSVINAREKIFKELAERRELDQKVAAADVIIPEANEETDSEPKVVDDATEAQKQAASRKNEAVKKNQEKQRELLRQLEAVTFRTVYVDGQSVQAENIEVKLLPQFVSVFVVDS